MKKFLVILPLVFLLWFTFCCQKAEVAIPVVDVEAEEQAIRDIIQKTIEAKNRRDFDAVLNMYAEKTIAVDHGFPEREFSLEDHREYYQKSMEIIDTVEGGLKRVVISEAGDMAWSTGWNRNFRKSGVIVEMKWIAIWQKIDDEWKCVAIGGNLTKRTEPEEKK